MSDKKNGVTIKCPRCGFVWQYMGTKKVLCTCPDCNKKINIAQNQVKKKEEKPAEA